MMINAFEVDTGTAEEYLACPQAGGHTGITVSASKLHSHWQANYTNITCMST